MKYELKEIFILCVHFLICLRSIRSDNFDLKHLFEVVALYDFDARILKMDSFSVENFRKIPSKNRVSTLPAVDFIDSSSRRSIRSSTVLLPSRNNSGISFSFSAFSSIIQSIINVIKIYNF